VPPSFPGDAAPPTILFPHEPRAPAHAPRIAATADVAQRVEHDHPFHATIVVAGTVA